MNLGIKGLWNEKIRDTLRIRGAIQEYMHYTLFKIKIMDSTIFTN